MARSSSTFIRISRDSQSLFSPLLPIPRLSETEPGILEPKPATSSQTPPRCHSSAEPFNLNGISDIAHGVKDATSPLTWALLKRVCSFLYIWIPRLSSVAVIAVVLAVIMWAARKYGNVSTSVVSNLVWLLRNVYSFQDTIPSLSSGSVSETPGTEAGATGTSAPASKPQVLPQTYGAPELGLVLLGINTSFEFVRRHTLMLVDTLPDTLFEVAKPSLRSEVEHLSGPRYEASRTWAETRHNWEVETLSFYRSIDWESEKLEEMVHIAALKSEWVISPAAAYRWWKQRWVEDVRERKDESSIEAPDTEGAQGRGFSCPTRSRGPSSSDSGGLQEGS
ncbi:hypothetical protein CPLU01_15113 [Colletotrichum plurivorum]|uniref:Uncharacterized protein n=1 Tax=Colletotrichum plurivorum TaxID=2175906 RepID=A0A8H6JE67_9PEZI|nr:hypothetical protein CPLU01_15113 [Colletotrichum plurivorum]